MARFAVATLVAAALATIAAMPAQAAGAGCKAEVRICTIRTIAGPGGPIGTGEIKNAHVLVVSEGCQFDFVNYNPQAGYSFTFPFVLDAEATKRYAVKNCQVK